MQKRILDANERAVAVVEKTEVELKRPKSLNRDPNRATRNANACVD
jgi:hypothetical protein